MTLGLTLLSKGWITTGQLQQALDEQRRQKGVSIGEVLVRLGFATEEQITAGVATQWGYPVFTMKNWIPQVDFHIPRVLLELHSAVPVHYSPTANRVMIGFVDRIEHAFLYSLEVMTSSIAAPCFLTPVEYHHAVSRLQESDDREEVVFHRISGVPEMTRIVKSYAMEIDAVEARFGNCKSYLWIRLQAARQQMDLLFKLP
jgi:hypothetical protein